MKKIGDFIDRSKAFWERLSEGLEVQQLWREFSDEARASYGLYSKEIDWETLDKLPRQRRALKIAAALSWAVLLKLSPARRVFLLIGLLLGFFAVAAQSPIYTLLALSSLLLLLALELSDRITMKRDLEIAREIQRWLVPSMSPEFPGVDIAFMTRPANTVAGDYYDAFVRQPDNGLGHLLVVVADVAGKSVPAALLMATFQASLHTLAGAPTTLNELVAGLNRYACVHSLGGLRFTTAFLSEWDPEKRTLSYINAGHNHPMLRRSADGLFERLEIGGVPLGIRSGAVYDVGSVILQSGDLLVIFTDGVVEAENASEEEFGDSRLMEFLKSTPERSASEVLRSLTASLDAFVGKTRQHDDITCLVLRVS